MSASTFKTTPNAQPDYITLNDVPSPFSNRTPAHKVTGIIILALLLFALSGLMLGFTAGILNRHPQSSSSKTHIPSTTQSKPAAIQTPTNARVPLNCPLIDEAVYQGTPGSGPIYTLSAHAVDKSGQCTKSGKAIKQAGITFKLWLATVPDNQRIEIPASIWTHLEKLQQPLPHEVANGLTFENSSAQIQQSNEQGQSRWKFGLAPDTKPGKYYLVVLADWDGIYANWSWIYFEVKSPRA